MFKPRHRRRFRETSEDADDVDIFSRSGETLKRIAAQQEAQRAEKRLKRIAKQDAGKQVEDILASKKKITSPRRAVLDGDDDFIGTTEGKGSALPRRLDNDFTPPLRHSPRHIKSRTITLDDSDEEDTTGLRASNSKTLRAVATSGIAKPAQATADEDNDSDAEIRALAARSRARKAAAAAAAVEQTRLLQADSSSLPEAPATVGTAPVSRETISSTQTTTSSSPDPVISIFLHSRIPDTKPLIVNRRISQPLKAVRLAFCKTNHFNPALEASVFLTWRRRRLFDITTCKSLDIGVDAHSGEVYIKGDRLGGLLNSRTKPTDEDDDEDGSSPARLEMEVMTQEIYNADRQALHARLNGTAVPTPQSSTLARGSSTADAAEQRIKIILRSRGYEDYKLTVKPTTPFSQIVNAFRKQRGVPDGKEVYLVFDGDRLTEDASVGTSEIDDMDHVDVHVK